MQSLKILFLVTALVMLFSSCSKNQEKDSSKKEKDKKEKTESSTKDDISNSALSNYDLSSESPEILKLSKELKEISGLTFTSDGRLFAEQDEAGIIYQLDVNGGKIIKRFSLGNPPIKKDFEDIAYSDKNNKFYLIHSNGDIYEFSEGNDGESVDYKVYKTGLEKENDIEGMCYYEPSNSLLLACKGTSGVEDDLDKAVYSFSLDSMKLNPVPVFMLKKSEIKSYFNPSGIERDPITGSLFIIAANGNEIVEISKDGKYIGKEKLLKSIHVQPEGITFSSDGTLYISNEGKDGDGTIVIYPLKKK